MLIELKSFPSFNTRSSLWVLLLDTVVSKSLSLPELTLKDKKGNELISCCSMWSES